MKLRPPLKWLLLTLAAALVAMTLSVASFHKIESAFAAAAFAIAIVASGVLTNAPLWRGARSIDGTAVSARDALIATSTLIAVAYFWCGLAFYAIYLGTSIHWQHGWEYGTAMMAVGLGHVFYICRLSDPKDILASDKAVRTVVRLAGYQAVAIALALIWLIASGKAASLKGDWAANHLFIGGGFAVMSLSMIILKTHAALSERPPHRS